MDYELLVRCIAAGATKDTYHRARDDGTVGALAAAVANANGAQGATLCFRGNELLASNQTLAQAGITARHFVVAILRPIALRAFLRQEFAIVEDVAGLSVCGLDASVAACHAKCVELFREMLLDARGAPTNEALCSSLSRNFVFAVGDGPALEPLEQAVEDRYGLYVMSMKVPEWPFRPGWRGSFPAAGAAFTSAEWRPPRCCATREETFHTVTEARSRSIPYSPCSSAASPTARCVEQALNRLAREGDATYAEWSFGRAGPLGRAMEADVRAGTYAWDGPAERAARGGRDDLDDDHSTAVNEYVHQARAAGDGMQGWHPRSVL